MNHPLEKAKCLVAVDFPFYASLVFHIAETEMPAARFAELTGMPTMCVVSIPTGDGMYREEMWYAREFVESLTESVRLSAVCHEILHLALGHLFPWRIGTRDPQIWNAAADYVVNLVLKHSVGEGNRHFEIPKDWLCDDKYDGMSVEQVYEELIKNANNKKSCSKCCHGYAVKGGDKNANGGGWTPEQDAKWKDILIRAVTANYGKGQIPGDLERLVNDRINPKVPWTALLEKYISEVAQNDYDWAYPDQRFISGVQMSDGGRSPAAYIPDLHSGDVKAVVCLDLSGSMSAEEAAASLSETCSILRSKGISEVRFIAVDTKVAMDITLHPGDEVPTRFPNTGGGTDFCSLFEMIAEEPEPPKVMIFFTDMEATYPEEEPSFPVIFMNTKNGSVVDPPFGVVLNYDVTNG